MKSFDILITRYQQKVYSFVYRMVYCQEDAMDITQDVFIQIFRSVEKFRGDAKFSTWLYRIAANKTMDFLRKNKKTSYIELDKIGALQLHAVMPDTELQGDDPAALFLQEEKIRKLRRLIAGLPDKYRVVLTLFNYEELTYQQISESLEIPVKTVATRLYRAKLILKEKLREGGEFDGVP